MIGENHTDYARLVRTYCGVGCSIEVKLTGQEQWHGPEVPSLDY